MKKIKVILLAFVCLIIGLAFWVAFRIEANQQEYSFKPKVVATPRPTVKPSLKPVYKPTYQAPKPTPLPTPTPTPPQPQPTYIPYVPPVYNPPPAYSPIPFPSFEPYVAPTYEPYVINQEDVDRLIEQKEQRIADCKQACEIDSKNWNEFLGESTAPSGATSYEAAYDKLLRQCKASCE